MGITTNTGKTINDNDGGQNEIHTWKITITFKPQLILPKDKVDKYQW